MRSKQRCDHGVCLQAAQKLRFGPLISDELLTLLTLSGCCQLEFNCSEFSPRLLNALKCACSDILRWLLYARNCFVIFRRWCSYFYSSFKVTCKAISQPLKRADLTPFPLWNLKSAFLLSLFPAGAILLFIHSRVLEVGVWMLRPAAPKTACQICSPAAASEASAEVCAQIPSPSLPIPLRSCVLSVIAWLFPKETSDLAKMKWDDIDTIRLDKNSSVG